MHLSVVDHAIFFMPAVKCAKIMFEHHCENSNGLLLASFCTKPNSTDLHVGPVVVACGKEQTRPHYQKKNGPSQAHVILHYHLTFQNWEEESEQYHDILH